MTIKQFHLKTSFPMKRWTLSVNKAHQRALYLTTALALCLPNNWHPLTNFQPIVRRRWQPRAWRWWWGRWLIGYSKGISRRLAGDSEVTSRLFGGDYQVIRRWLAGDSELISRRFGGDWQAIGRRFGGDWHNSEVIDILRWLAGDSKVINRWFGGDYHVISSWLAGD